MSEQEIDAELKALADKAGVPFAHVRAAFLGLTNAFEKAAEKLRLAAAELAREKLDLYRGQWWKRGEGEPEYLADLPESEWWKDGEPPDFFQAA